MKNLVIDISIIITVMKFFKLKTTLIEKQIVMKVSLLLLSSFSLLGFSQQLDETPKIVSPNVASIERFGDIPVSLYTGTPNISIPIHTVSSGSINVPINLRYHSASVRVSAQPSWAGLGWDLSPYGSITRKLEGHLDEFDITPAKGAAGIPIVAYYPDPQSAYPNDISGSEALQDADWTNVNTASNDLHKRWVDNDSKQKPFTDFSPDEFNFNFMGYSGKFFYMGPTKGWQVVSDQKIKVQLLGFLNSNDIINIGEQYDHIESGSNHNPFEEKIFVRSFSGFILTTPDGTKYEFGGRDAIEFSSAISVKTGNGSSDLNPFAFNSNSWLLKKITDKNNNEVVFNYERKLPTCNMSYGFKRTTPNNFSIIPNPNRDLSGSFQWSVLLKSIETRNESVFFNSSYSNGLRYKDEILHNVYRDDKLTLSFDLSAIDNNTDNLKWSKLDNIVIKDKHNKLHQTHTFRYREKSPNTGRSQRLELSNYSTGNIGNKKIYRFEYDNIDQLPESYVGNFADHWGYYNGIDFTDESKGGREFTREPNINSTKGLIKKINYPTGGYTEYNWESHDYRRTLNDEKNGVEYYRTNQLGGGNRIRTIKSFSKNNDLLTSKTYLYKGSYSNSGNINLLRSSGILSGRPRYTMNDGLRTLLYGPSSNVRCAVKIGMTTFNSIDTQNNNGAGSPIGYDEVVELNLDGSYTKHFFTSFGRDYNGNSHFDKLPIGGIGWYEKEDASYRHYSSLSMERGKPIATKRYNKEDILVQKAKTFYRNDEARFNNGIRRIATKHIEKLSSGSFHDCQGPNLLVLATAFHDYTYNYYPIRTENTVYNIDGTNPIVTNEYYEYDSYNQMKSKVTTSSLGKNYKTTLNYPYDLALSEIETGTFDHYPYDEYSITVTNIYEKMVQKNMISYPIEVIKEYDNTIINSNVTEYESSGYTSTNNYRILPSKSYSSKNNNNYTFAQPDIQEGLILDNSLEEKIIFHSYNNNGNPTEISKEGGSHTVYIWGYNETYPIAKIENATKSQVFLYVSNIKNLSNKDDDRTLNYLGNEGKLREALDNLRSLSSLKNALITTYTYDPLIGITSITDSRGEAVYYEYDNFNRLKFIKDAQGNLTQETQYNYKN